MRFGDGTHAKKRFCGMTTNRDSSVSFFSSSHTLEIAMNTQGTTANTSGLAQGLAQGQGQGQRLESNSAILELLTFSWAGIGQQGMQAQPGQPTHLGGLAGQFTRSRSILDDSQI